MLRLWQLVAMLPLQLAFGVWLVAETLLLALLAGCSSTRCKCDLAHRVLVLVLVLTSLPVLLTLLHGPAFVFAGACSLCGVAQLQAEAR
jgi:hypothetical protein